MVVVSLTCICADVYDGTDIVRAGGEALNFSANISTFEGIDAFLIGAVGTDKYGESILRQAKEFPLDISHVHIIEGETAHNITYLTEGGDRYYKADSWHGGVYQDFVPDADDEALLARADWVHITSACPVLGNVIGMKRKYGFNLAVDFNVRRDIENWLPLLPFIDLMFVSADDELLPILRELSEKFGCIFIGTLAERGSRAFRKGTETVCAAVKVDNVIDTTGCGDSFEAGFVASYSQYGDILKAMESGSLAASRVLSHYGGF